MTPQEVITMIFDSPGMMLLAEILETARFMFKDVFPEFTACIDHDPHELQVISFMKTSYELINCAQID